MNIVDKYFPHITKYQKEKIAELCELYKYWNAKINVISRKDIDNLFVHHILFSLTLSKIISFRNGTRILDVGTGGGLPGIPLAIIMPEAEFHLIDSARKKTKVASEISASLGLKNVTTEHIYSKEIKQKFDFTLGRAVKPFNEFYKLVKHTIHTRNKNVMPNGIFYYTGGDTSNELSGFNGYTIYPLANYCKEQFFSNKKIIYKSIS